MLRKIKGISAAVLAVCLSLNLIITVFAGSMSSLFGTRAGEAAAFGVTKNAAISITPTHEQGFSARKTLAEITGITLQVPAIDEDEQDEIISENSDKQSTEDEQPNIDASDSTEEVYADEESADADEVSADADEVSADEKEDDDNTSNDPLKAMFGDDLVMSNVNDSVNIRKEPNEESDIVGKLYHNCAGEKMHRKDGWTKIRSGSVVGWVNDDYLIFDDEAETLARQAGATLATVNTQTLRIREEADENSSVYGLLGEGEKIEVIEQEGDWIKVAYSDDTEGYISGDYVSLDYEIDEAESIEEIEKRKAEEKAREEAAKAQKEKEAKAKKERDAKRTTETTTTNNGSVAAQADDVTLLAALIQAECGREVYAGKLAVGAVVVNRARGRYGSIYNAIYAPGQFGPAASGKVAAYVAAGPTAECIKAAQEAISGVSNIGAATHFRNIRSGYSGIVIGNHVFW